MKYVDAEREPNKWLKLTLSSMVGDPQYEDDLRQALEVLVEWMEPGVVAECFAGWIKPYQDLVKSQENSRSIADPPCSLEDP